MPPPTLQSFLDAAEENFRSQNLEEAIKKANMARDYVDRFLITYQVHVVSQMTTNGVYDWYAILGIEDCKADAEDIKNAYRKLALKIHPDKNSSAAAEDAFKLVYGAWKVLSVPSSRQTYDQRRGPARPRKRPWQEKDERDKASPKSPKCPASSEQVPPNNGARAWDQSNTSVPNSQAPPDSTSGPGNNQGGGTNSENQAPSYGGSGSGRGAAGQSGAYASHYQAPPNTGATGSTNCNGTWAKNNQAPHYTAPGAARPGCNI